MLCCLFPKSKRRTTSRKQEEFTRLTNYSDISFCYLRANTSQDEYPPMKFQPTLPPNVYLPNRASISSKPVYSHVQPVSMCETPGGSMNVDAAKELIQQNPNFDEILQRGFV
ncbi:hypothetical protein K7432_008163, partial [Basidiobolus ranarum]